MDDKMEQIKRGKRIRAIRENELKMNKKELANCLGISPQFQGVIEEGKGNLSYKNLKKLMELSGHSSDYILFGLDDNAIAETKRYLKKYSANQILATINIIKEISLFISDDEI